MSLPDWIQPAEKPTADYDDPIVEYHADGLTIKRLTYHNGWIKGHRIDGPAVTTWHANGVKASESWRINGQSHRDNRAAHLKWDEKGMLCGEFWYQRDRRHREDGPAMQWYEEDGRRSEEWFLHDKHSRNPGYREYDADGNMIPRGQ